VAELSPYALRLALYLVLMLLFGRMLFVRPGLPRGVPLALALIALAVVVTDAITRLGVLGIAPADIDPATAHWFLTGTPVGKAGLLRTVAVLAMLPLLAFATPLQGLRRVALLAGSPRRWPACPGTASRCRRWVRRHAAAGGRHRAPAGRRRLGRRDRRHPAVGAASTGPAPARAHPRVWRAAHSFALPGTIIVALLAMTGTYTYVDLGGSVQTLTGTAHGRWLLLKLALVVGMLGLAALHRWRLVPALATSIRDGWQPRPLRSLRHSLACESVLAVLVLACVAVLGTLDPLASLRSRPTCKLR
jgi:putative copper resistance protein D